MGEMNLLAIEALNINSKVTVSMDSKIQKAGAAMPLRFQKSRMGAVVLQGAGSSSSQLAELLSKTIELLYEELILSRKNKTGPRSGTSFSMNGCTCSPIIRKIFIKRGSIWVLISQETTP